MFRGFHISLTCLFVLGSFISMAQDTIVTLRNETLEVKVLELDYTNEVVKFKKSVLPNGPTYSERMSDLFLISIANTPPIYNDPYENPYPGYQTVVPISMKRLERYSPAEHSFVDSYSRAELQRQRVENENSFASNESEQRFREIFDKVVNATREYCRSRNFSIADEFDWQFVYVDCFEGYHGSCKIHSSITHTELDNAFSMGNGNFFFSEYYFKDASDDEIAGVVAHEIGHAIAMHLLEKKRKLDHQKEASEWIALGATVAHGGSYQANRNFIADISDVFFMLPYKREHEREADKIGVVLMQFAGYDPKSMIRYWRSDNRGTQTKYWSTHPGGLERANLLEEFIYSTEFKILTKKR